MSITNKLLIILVLFLSFTTNIYSMSEKEKLDKYIGKSTEELLDEGYNLTYIQNKPQLAIVPLNIIIHRYNQEMNAQDKMACCSAHLYYSYIYLYHLFDYSRAYDNLVKAEEIRDELGVEFPFVDSHFGALYHTLHSISKDESFNDMALEHFKKAFNSANKTENIDMLDAMFSNILVTIFKNDNLSEIKNEWNIYKNAKHSDNDSLFVTNCKFYYLLDHIEKKQYNEAISLSDSIIKYVGDSEILSRKRFNAYLLKSMVYEKTGNYYASVNQAILMMNMANKYNYSEEKIEAYEVLSNYYKLLGDKENFFKYRTKYYDLRDTMLSFSQVTAISKKPLVNEIEKMNTIMSDIRIKDKIQKNIILFFIVALTIIIISTLLIMKKNKLLNQSNRNLFLNYQNLIKSQEEEHRQLKEYINKYNSLKESNEKSIEKYQGSKLESDYINELLDKILSVMEDVEEISSPAFSMKRLVELASSNYTYVSQVINDKCGCNFSQLLNKYRIKEVCRRLSDEDNYGQYTTEAIAESVGFKSRSAFANSFKKVTGLTPSQYKKIVKEENLCTA